MIRKEEHTEQVNLMKWWAMACNSYGLPERIFFAIPNGGNRNVITGKMLKEEGVRPGVPDLFLPVPCGGFHGLFIEMKKQKGGVISPFQQVFIDRLRYLGYKAEVCNGWESAKTVIENYLLGEKACLTKSQSSATQEEQSK